MATVTNVRSNASRDERRSFFTGVEGTRISLSFTATVGTQEVWSCPTVEVCGGCVQVVDPHGDLRYAPRTPLFEITNLTYGKNPITRQDSAAMLWEALHLLAVETNLENPPRVPWHRWKWR